MRVCDRCGKETAIYEAQIYNLSWWHKLVAAVESAIVWKPEPIERIDLCPECYRQLKEWTKEKKQK